MSAQSRGDMLAAGMTFSAGTMAYSHITPLRCTPNVSLCSQALTRPLRHEAQCPQLVYGVGVTTIPGLSNCCTSGATASMTAPISWPGITGIFTIGLRPKYVLRSEPQNPT